MINVINLAWLMGRQRCLYTKCKKQFSDGLVHLKGKYNKNFEWWPDGNFLFHYQDTHGFPHEMMIEEFKRVIESPMSEQQIKLYNLAIKEKVLKK